MSLDHAVEYIRILRRILDPPLNAYYVIHIPASILPSVSASKIVDIYQLDASMGPMLILSTQFRLKPMDIVYVTSAPIARWNKLLNQLTSSLSGIYQVEVIQRGN